MQVINLFDKINEIYNELDRLDRHYRNLYFSALDIEDGTDALVASEAAHTAFRKLKALKKTTDELRDDFEQSNITEILMAKASSGADKSKADINAECEGFSQDSGLLGDIRNDDSDFYDMQLKLPPDGEPQAVEESAEAGEAEENTEESINEDAEEPPDAGASEPEEVAEEPVIAEIPQEDKVDDEIAAILQSVKEQDVSQDLAPITESDLTQLLENYDEEIAENPVTDFQPNEVQYDLASEPITEPEQVIEHEEKLEFTEPTLDTATSEDEELASEILGLDIPELAPEVEEFFETLEANTEASELSSFIAETPENPIETELAPEATEPAAIDLSAIMETPESEAFDLDAIIETPEAETFDLGAITDTSEAEAFDLGAITDTPETEAFDLGAITDTPETEAFDLGEITDTPETEAFDLGEITDTPETEAFGLGEITDTPETEAFDLGEITDTPETEAFDLGAIMDTAEQEVFDIGSITEASEILPDTGDSPEVLTESPTDFSALFEASETALPETNVLADIINETSLEEALDTTALFDLPNETPVDIDSALQALMAEDAAAEPITEDIPIPDLIVPEITPVEATQPVKSGNEIYKPYTANNIEGILKAASSNNMSEIIRSATANNMDEIIKAAAAGVKIEANDVAYTNKKVTVSLEEPSFYNGKSPVKIVLLDKEYAVKDWSEILIKVCFIMHLHNPPVVAKFDKNDSLNTGESPNFSYREEDIKSNKRRLPNGLWIETDKTPEEITQLCRKILEISGYSATDLSIILNQ